MYYFMPFSTLAQATWTVLPSRCGPLEPNRPRRQFNPEYQRLTVVRKTEDNLRRPNVVPTKANGALRCCDDHPDCLGHRARCIWWRCRLASNATNVYDDRQGSATQVETMKTDWRSTDAESPQDAPAQDIARSA
jgi:hypothetical protein